MIDEDALAELLAERAERIPVPEGAVDALLGAVSVSPRSLPRFARPSTRLVAAAAAVLVVVGAVALVHAGSTSDRKTVALQTGGAGPLQSGEVPAAPPTTAATGGDALRYRAGKPANGATTDGIIHSETDASAGRFPPDPPAKPTTPSPPRAPTDSAHVVKTGAIDLRVARHGFGTMVGRATTIAASEGGFVSDASTDESAAVPSGHLTLRVPSARFDDAVRRLRTLGKVLTASTRGVDASGQFTDLQARLRAANATREAYLTVLAKATNIGDILAVQDRIESVQTQIEQLQGQLNGLNNRTSYATITLSLAEPGPKPNAAVVPHHKSGLAVAWDNARDGFARRIEGVISHSGSALVITLGLLLLALALRLLLPRALRLLV